MRLFLSSEDLGNYPEALLELVGENNKVAFVNNAKDDWKSEDRAAKSAEKKHMFHQLGFEVHEFDLRSYFGKADKLQKDLENFGLVWCSGGNTFILRRAMAASGLDKILKKRLSLDDIAYGGSSAGAIIPTPSLRGTHLGDDPKSVPRGYDPKIIWTGLKLVPFYVVPHVGSSWFGKEAEAMAAYFRQRGWRHKLLRDGQVIVVEGNKVEFLK